MPGARHDPRTLLERLLEPAEQPRPLTRAAQVEALHRSIRRSLADMVATRPGRSAALPEAGVPDIPMSGLPGAPDTSAAGPTLRRIGKMLAGQIERWEPRLHRPTVRHSWNAGRQELSFVVRGTARSSGLDGGVFELELTLQNGRLTAPEFARESLPRPS
jgi:type VI secretion system lysozyme-like protein